MNITWRPRAVEDFERLIDLSSAGNSANASRDKSLLETRIAQLVRFDQLGRKSRRIGCANCRSRGRRTWWSTDGWRMSC